MLINVHCSPIVAKESLQMVRVEQFGLTRVRPCLETNPAVHYFFLLALDDTC